MDRHNSSGVSKAIWIPFTWMFLSGSRYVSQWFNLGVPGGSTDSILEGSPVDRIVFIILIIAGIVVLFRRRINWKEIFRKNVWIWLFFLFGAISLLWSDFPFVAFKRWIKALGNIVMVLVILSEHRPYHAFGIILRRLAFILLPLSVLFIKYYPDLGRAYHMGHPMFTGVTYQKNQLGQLCLLTGLYFSWFLLLGRKTQYEFHHKFHYSIYLIILPITAWLFHMANSATSMLCLLIAIFIFLFSSLPTMSDHPRRILYFSILFVGVYFFMNYFFEVKNFVIGLLGRRPDLTTRVPMWEDLRSMVKNPLLGFGFESFWLGDRRRIIMETWGIGGQAHNGYLDMYLHLGYLGLSFIFFWIISGIRKIHKHLVRDYPVAVLRFSLFTIVALYNYTEATFYGVSNMWIIFLIGIMDVPSLYGIRSTPKPPKDLLA